MARFWKLAAGATAILLFQANGALAAPKPARPTPAHAGRAHGAASPARIDGRPNLNGIWFADDRVDWGLEPHSPGPSPVAGEDLGALGAMPASLGVVEGGTIPYLPAGLQQRDKNRSAAPKADPEAACYLPGIPRATYAGGHAFQIVQGGHDDILFVYEYANANRVIHMQKAEEPPIDTWMGTSYGQWNGDTLVVTTLGQNGRTWLDRAGDYLTPTSKVTERFTLKDPDHIAYEATIEDPAVYSKPWKISMPLYRRVNRNAELLEFNCVPFSELLVYGDLLPKKDAK